MSDTGEKSDHAEGRPLGPVDRVVDFVALWIGGPVLGFMVAVTVVDVTLRYVFNSPIFGAEDFSSLSMSVAVAAAIAYSGKTGGQVSVELFVNLMSPRVTAVTEVIVRLLSISMLGILSWRLVIAGIDAAKYGEASFALLISFEPFFYILAASMLLYAIVLVAELIVNFRPVPQKRSTDL